MSQEQRQTIHCPECTEILYKISCVSVGCEVDIVCPKCKKKINIRFTVDGVKRYLEAEE